MPFRMMPQPRSYHCQGDECMSDSRLGLSDWIQPRWPEFRPRARRGSSAAAISSSSPNESRRQKTSNHQFLQLLRFSHWLTHATRVAALPTQLPDFGSRINTQRIIVPCAVVPLAAHSPNNNNSRHQPAPVDVKRSEARRFTERKPRGECEPAITCSFHTATRHSAAPSEPQAEAQTPGPASRQAHRLPSAIRVG
jgi:hypothetical protein